MSSILGYEAAPKGNQIRGFEDASTNEDEDTKFSPNIEIRLPTVAGSLKQAIIDYRVAKTSISHIKLGHTVTASLSPAFIQNSAGETVRSKNREYAGSEPSELTDKFIDIQGTKLDTSRASTEQCCYLQEYYELSPANVGTAITTKAHPPLPFVTAIFCHNS